MFPRPPVVGPLVLLAAFVASCVCRAAAPQPSSPAPSSTAPSSAAPSAAPTAAASSSTASALVASLKPPAGATAAEVEAYRQVERLGDERFAAREMATQALMKMGVVAHSALLAGSRHVDREVRYRCERILILARQAELENRIRAFLNDAGTGHPYDFPSWDIFQKNFGDSRESRQTFADMQRAEPDLLAKLADGNRPGFEALNNRCSEVQQQMQAHSQELGIGTVTALLFLAVETRADTQQQTSSTIYNFCYQGSFRNSINGGANRDILKRLLGQWIRRGRDFQAYQGIMLSLQYDLKEGIEPARELINNPNMQAQMKQYAVLAIAKLGDRSHMGLIEPLLTDDKSCGIRQMNNVNINTQIRDVALAGLVHMTGQEFKTYGFDRISMNALYLFDPLSTGFESTEKRDQAFEKWRAFRAREKEQAAAPKNG